MCYVVYDEELKRCIAIDPGSKNSENEIAFIESKRLTLDFIIITHEHTDHCYGVNALKKRYTQSQVVFSEGCNKNIKKANRIFFQFYFDGVENLEEVIPTSDIIIQSSESILQWYNYTIRFQLTPGHSIGSMCISIDNILFTGDTVLQFPPVFCGIGCDKDVWKKSVLEVLSLFKEDVMVYPGHGEPFKLGEYKRYEI